MKIKLTFLKILILLSFPLFSTIYSQGSGDIRLSGVFVNDNPIAESAWNNLSISTKDSITFLVDTPAGLQETVYTRVYLNGVLYSPGQIIKGSRVTLSGFHKGNVFLKIECYTSNGWISEPILHHLVVRDSGLDAADSSEVKQNSGELPLYVYILLIVCAVQFALIIYLALTKRKKASPASSKEKELSSELADFRYTYSRLKDQMQNQIEENSFLKDQIKNLEYNINNLEKTNIHLLEQKERLANSKHQLEYLQDQKEELFAHAIHDIKNPASAIRSYIELLNSYDLNATEQQEIMTSIIESSEDIVKLSQEMCTIIAKSEPEHKLNFQKVPIKSIIDEVVTHNMTYAKSKKIKLTKKTSDAIPEVVVDVERIEETLDNLINNAIKYGPAESSVEVISYRKNDFVAVEVRDTGFGLSEEDIKKAFHKGATLSNRPTGVEMSSGLGLWLVKTNVEAHHGKVWVESKLGIGSTFAFELPLNRNRSNE